MKETYIDYKDRPIIEKASQLEEYSSWRRFLREFEKISDAEEALQFARQEAHGCFLAFCYLMSDFKLIVTDFHEILAAAYEDVRHQRYQNVMISCAPRSGKSFLSQMYIAWLIGIESENYHIISSYGKQLSSTFERKIRALTKSPEFLRIFPGFEGYEEMAKNNLKSGGTLLSASPGSALTGFSAGSHSNSSESIGAMLVDDPVKSSNEKAALKVLPIWWEEEATTRRTFRHAYILIATRFSHADLHAVLAKRDGYWDPIRNPNGWRKINIEALCEHPEIDPLERELGESFWGDGSNPLFTREALEQKRESMSDNVWQSLYQGRPTAAQGSIVKTSDIYELPRDSFPTMKRYFAAVDCAMSEKQDSDESVITVFGLPKDSSDNKIYLCDCFHGRWAFPDLISYTKHAVELYGIKTLAIEKAVSGFALIQTLEKETNLEILPMPPVKSKQVRLQSVLHLLQRNRVVFPISQEWTEYGTSQLKNFPLDVHDDFVDSLVWGLIYYMKELETSESSSDILALLDSKPSSTKRSVHRTSNYDGLISSRKSRAISI